MFTAVKTSIFCLFWSVRLMYQIEQTFHLWFEQTLTHGVLRFEVWGGKSFYTRTVKGSPTQTFLITVTVEKRWQTLSTFQYDQHIWIRLEKTNFADLAKVYVVESSRESYNIIIYSSLFFL